MTDLNPQEKPFETRVQNSDDQVRSLQYYLEDPVVLLALYEEQKACTGSVIETTIPEHTTSLDINGPFANQIMAARLANESLLQEIRYPDSRLARVASAVTSLFR